ncbi:MAG: hypothetical protein HMLIMOIP_002732 [Candidatus Nitrosomirales archaeon]|jgi:hypothetical protein
MAVQTLNLAAGTNLTRHFVLPKCGSWAGAVSVSLSTFGTSATIAEWLFINPDVGDGKIRYRRTGGTLAGNFFNGPLPADSRGSRGLYKGESLMRITYTATNEISMCIETTRTLTPANYPAIPASSGAANAIVVPGNLSKVYWLPV